MASTSRHAFFVALGILFSRIVGLIRERVFASCFGNSDAADAFKAALRIPNFLQNLFGEGVLSASLIPGYVSLRAQEKEKAARELASVVGSFLIVTMSLLALLGVLFADSLVAVLAPGFTGEKRELTMRIVQVLFPGISLLVLSAWCLGILNSHRRFFLPYAAPVVWSSAIIAVLYWGQGRYPLDELAVVAAWGVVLGSLLQFCIQLPVALKLLGGFRFSLDRTREGVGQVFRTFFPAVMTRGVVQISAWVDSLIASLLPAGAVAALAYSQTISLLPVSLFGMSVSAAELPELSSLAGKDSGAGDKIRARINSGLGRIAFFVIPSAVSFLFLGDYIVALLFQTGRFTADDSRYVWSILAGSAIGLGAATAGRLYSSAFYALRDTDTPFRCALGRVTVSALIASVLAFWGPEWFGIEARWGVAGITVGSGVAAWLEFAALRHLLGKKIGATAVGGEKLLKIWGVSIVCGALARGWGTLDVVPGAFFSSAVVLGIFGGSYLGVTALMGIEEGKRIKGFLFRR